MAARLQPLPQLLERLHLPLLGGESQNAAVTAPRVPHRLPQTLTHTEVYKLMEACEASYFRLHRVRDRCIIGLLACLGLRRQELMDLRVEDWDATERVLRVRSGKGDRERLLPLTDELIALVPC